MRHRRLRGSGRRRRSLVAGLRKLEYRGYDSAGSRSPIRSDEGGPLPGQAVGAREAGRRRSRRPARWASATRAGRRTAGPSEENAHPHKVGAGRGRPQRHHREPPRAARARSRRAGATFTSETDTEIVAHLIDEALQAGAPTWSRRCARRCARSRAPTRSSVMSDDAPGPDRRRQERLAAGGRPRRGRELPRLRRPAHPRAHARGDLPRGRRDRRAHARRAIELTDLDGRRRSTRAPKTITWDAAQAEKGGYKHFMLKEIHEQPRAIADTLRGAAAARDATTPTSTASSVDVATLRRVVLRRVRHLVPRGAGRQVPDRGAGAHPVRGRAGQRVPLPRPGRRPRRPGRRHLAVGETADTLAAVKEAKARGARVLAICNVVDSAIPRAARRRALHPRRARDRRRVDQVLHRAAGGAGAARDPPRPPHAARWPTRAARRADRRARRACPHKMREALAALGDMVRTLAQAATSDAQRLPLPRPRHQLPDRARGRAQAEGDLVHPRRGLRRRRDEARPDRADRRRHAGGGASRRGARATRRCCRTWTRCGPATGTVIAVATEGDTDDRASSADGVSVVPDAPALLQPLLTVLPLQLLAYDVALATRQRRRPAAQPGQERHGRVTASGRAAARGRHIAPSGYTVSTVIVNVSAVPVSACRNASALPP